MKSCGILRSYEEEKKVYGLAIVRIELNAPGRAPEYEEDVLQPSEAPMGDRHIVTDPGASQGLPIQEDLDELIDIFDLAGLLKMADHLPQDPFCSGGL